MDELFTRKLGNMEVVPPEDGWIRIENELNRRRTVTRRYWLAAASIALILSATATMMYIQTNVPTNPTGIIVATQENTSQRLEEEPLSTNGDIAVAQEENRQNRVVSQQNQNNATQAGTATNMQVVAQNNVVVSDISDVSIVPNVPDVQDDKTIHSSIPVYINSWNELIRTQPVTLTQRKIAQLKMKISDQQKEETDAVVSSTVVSAAIPKYDDLSYFDITSSIARSQPRNRWEMTGQFAPMYSYRAISSVPSGVRRSDFNDAESPLLTYSGGIAVSYSVFKRLSIQTGVFYSQMGQSINSVIPVPNMYAAVSSNNSYTKNFVRTSTGSVTVPSNLKSDANTTYSSYFNAESQTAVANSVADIAGPAKYRLIERIDYFEVPLLLRYKIVDRKLNLYVLGGMSVNMLINNNVLIDNGSEIVKGGTILMARPVNYSSTLGLGLGYQITRNLSFGLEPLFKYYLQSYTTSSQIDSNPYTFGLFSGVVYRF